MSEFIITQARKIPVTSVLYITDLSITLINGEVFTIGPDGIKHEIVVPNHRVNDSGDWVDASGAVIRGTAS